MADNLTVDGNGVRTKDRDGVHAQGMVLDVGGGTDTEMLTTGFLPSVVKGSNYTGAATAVPGLTLDSLADDGRAISTALTNATTYPTTPEAYIDLELLLDLAGTPVRDEVVDVYLLPSLDGTNFATGDASTTPASDLLVFSFHVIAATDQRLVAANIPLPVGLFKFLVHNQSGVAFSATGSTLRYRAHS